MNGYKAALDSLLSIITGSVSIVCAVVLASLIEWLLIPNPCQYHSGEYLTGKESPWWINTFFPLDTIGHPETSILFYALCLTFGTVRIYVILRNLTKRVEKWRVKMN